MNGWGLSRTVPALLALAIGWTTVQAAPGRAAPADPRAGRVAEVRHHHEFRGAHEPSSAQLEPPTKLSTGLADSGLREEVRRLGRKGAARLVTVEVITSGASAAEAVHAVGGRVISDAAPGITLARVQADRLVALEGEADVRYVRTPQKVDGPDTSEPAEPPGRELASVERWAGRLGYDAFQKTRVASWHAAGYTGAGVKVGIIDSFNGGVWDSAAQAGEVPLRGNVAGFCQRNGTNCNATFWNTPASYGDHGVAVAEAIKDMAPNAQLYLVQYESINDLYAAINSMAQNGVQIVSRSLAAHYDGRGMGDGELDQAIAYAVSLGMAWFNSAGNSGGVAEVNPGSYYRDLFTDTDGDGIHNFPDGTEIMGFNCSFIMGLRWDDWVVNATDYDARIYNQQGQLVGVSEDTQGNGLPPLEHPDCNAPSGEIVYLQIVRLSVGNGFNDDTLEFMTNGYATEFWQNPFSAAAAGVDFNIPGALAIGAVDPVQGVAIAPYSSQGPTNDGRIKPDMSGASNMTNHTLGRFNGTSAATPVVAGGAAVVLQAYPATTPAQLTFFLQNSLVMDRGVLGPDRVFGTGELTFGGPGSRITGVSMRPQKGGRVQKRTVPLNLRLSSDYLTGVAQYDVWRRNSAGSLVPLVRTSSAGSVTVGGAFGRTDVYAARVIDYARVANAMSSQRRFRPTFVDDKSSKVKRSGRWSRLRVSGAMKGKVLASGSRRASLKLRFTGSAVGIVVARHSNTGKLAVYVDGRRVGTVNTRSGSKDSRRIIASYGLSAGRHTVKVKPLGTRGRPTIKVDGFVLVG